MAETHKSTHTNPSFGQEAAQSSLEQITAAVEKGQGRGRPPPDTPDTQLPLLGNTFSSLLL